MPGNSHDCGQELMNCKSFESCKSAVHVFSSSRFEKLETLLSALEERIKLQFFLTNEAYQLRNVQIDKRMDTMNEFRGAMEDRESSYFTRTEHEMYSKLVESDLRFLREANAKSEGKASQSSVIFALLISIVGVVTGAAGIVLRMIGK